MQDKKYLRRLYKEKRSLIGQKESKASAAADILLECNKIAAADTILLYASFGSELGTGYLIDKLLSLKKKIACPKCYDNGIMKFYYISSPDSLKPGKYGIPEPDESNDTPEITDRTVCIVPGLAFTETGIRLGYGGGFYDRFTAVFPKLYTIGFTYEELLVAELPALSHDLRVNAVVTEERMVYCSGK